MAESFCSGRLTELLHSPSLLGDPASGIPIDTTRNCETHWPGMESPGAGNNTPRLGRHRLAHPPHAGHGPSRLTAPTTTRSKLPHERDRSLARRPASYVRPRLTVSSALSLAKARKSAILGDPSHWPTGRDHSLHGFGLEVKAPNHDARLAWQCVSIPRSTILDYPLSQHTNARYPGPLQPSRRLKGQLTYPAVVPNRPRPGGAQWSPHRAA